MEPEPRELLPGGALGLRDLVLVMRKHQVDAAGVQVDGPGPEQPQRHRRALQMPAWPAGTRAVVPRRLVGLGRLPQHEVARVVLRVLVHVHADARLHAFGVEVRQAAVGRERRDLEVDRPVATVGVAVVLERQHHLAHRAEVHLVGGARRLLRRLEAQARRVLAERLDPGVGVLAQRLAGLGGAGDGLVVHVGVVEDAAHLMAAEILQRPAQHIEADEGAEVADVAAVVDGEPARIHPHGVVVRRRERLFLSGQRVVQTQHRNRIRAPATSCGRRRRAGWTRC